MIKLPNQPKVIKKEKNKAFFEIEPLHPGYGITVGNSLRRVLFSSLEGAAVTQMKIKNVSHEFSTISGVLEDVITIMLNLKQIGFKIFSDEPQKATLKARGEKEIKGFDFNIPSQVEMVNKDCHVATLTSKSAELEMEIQIEKGIGYSPREERQKEKLEIGAIPIDAIFTPIKRVNYKVENMRVGKRTDYDRLLLEIETNGAISPEEAFSRAAGILLDHFSLFSDTFNPEIPLKTKVKEKKKEEEKEKEKKKKPSSKIKDAQKKKGKKAE